MRAAIQIFKYRLYTKEFFTIFFCYLLVEPTFSWLFIQNALVTTLYVKILSIGVLAFVLYDLRSLKTSEKVFVGLFMALMVKLVFESVFFYNTPFKQFAIYTVIFPVIYVIFIKLLMRKLSADLLEMIAKFYLITYIIFMVLFGREFSLSLVEIEKNVGPYSGDTRIIHASSIFMIIIPYLWYLNQFVRTSKLKALMFFVLCFVIILVHQHRSVWSSTIVATLFYFFMVVRSSRNAIPNVLKIFLLATLLMIGSYVVISNSFPNVLDYFGDRFSEILNPAKEGSTGNFRIEQSLLYWGYIAQKPLFGWSFAGFDLQNPLVDWWDEGTGHHFHQGYVEILFYHGVVGLILKYGFLFYILFKAFGKKLTDESLVLVPFCISGLIFSLNYVPILMFWGHVGMCLFYLESRDRYRGTIISGKLEDKQVEKFI